MGYTKFNKSYIFEISIISHIFWYIFLYHNSVNIPFLGFRLLLSRVARYLQFATLNCLKIAAWSSKITDTGRRFKIFHSFTDNCGWKDEFKLSSFLPLVVFSNTYFDQLQYG